MLRSDRRPSGPRMRHPFVVRGGQEHYHRRRFGRGRAVASPSERLSRRASGPMRILHERRHDRRRCAPGEKPQADRRRSARLARPQSVPLRLAQPHGACGVARGSGNSAMNTLAESRLKRKGSLEKNPRLSQWLRVLRDGAVSIYSGKVEIGQGILTALAQIAAEELGIALERIRMIAADTSVSPDEGVTSGSLSIQDSGAALGRACAQARTLLLERAAAHLGVSPGDLQVKDGVVRAAGLSTTFWECANDALFDCEIDETAELRSLRDYRVVGKPAARRDLPDKIAGRPHFIQDMMLPGMLYGRVVRPPHNFAGLILLDDSKVKSMQGLTAIVRDGGFVGVLAEREDVAISAQRALRLAASWKEIDPMPQDVHAWLKEHAAEHRVISEKENADVKSRGVTMLEASYTKPYISHASIGPSCATAQIDDGKLMVWSHSQGIFNLRRDLALALAMREDAIVVRHVEGAGCNGHSSRPGRSQGPALAAAWHLARPHERPSAINLPLPAGAADRNAIPIYDFPNQRVVNHY